jgi:hypothetical protein
MEAPVISALIAGAVSLVGVGVAVYSARHQLLTRMSELELKREELENLSRKLAAEAEALRQNLLRDILTKRMLAYAALWKVFITYERNWLLEQKDFDLKWANSFLRDLNACNAEHGVFFSQRVYVPFFEYRKRLLNLVAHLKGGSSVGPTEIDSLIEISTRGLPGEMAALGTALKDDLGSYMKIAIQAS